MATYFTLNTGARIPSVGLGTYKAGPGVVGDLIAAAVKVLSTPPSRFCSELYSTGDQEGPWPRSMAHIALGGCVGLPSPQVGEWTS